MGSNTSFSSDGLKEDDVISKLKSCVTQLERAQSRLKNVPEASEANLSSTIRDYGYNEIQPIINDITSARKYIEKKIKSLEEADRKSKAILKGIGLSGYNNLFSNTNNNGSRSNSSNVTKNGDKGKVDPKEKEQQYNVYIVEEGEWLLKFIYANDYEYSDLEWIAKLNGIENPDLIYPGQKIIIPKKEDIEAKAEESEETTKTVENNTKKGSNTSRSNSSQVSGTKKESEATKSSVTTNTQTKTKTNTSTSTSKTDSSTKVDGTGKESEGTKSSVTTNTQTKTNTSTSKTNSSTKVDGTGKESEKTKLDKDKELEKKKGPAPAKDVASLDIEPEPEPMPEPIVNQDPPPEVFEYLFYEVIEDSNTLNETGYSKTIYTDYGERRFRIYEQNYGKYADYVYHGAYMKDYGCSLAATATVLSGFGIDVNPGSFLEDQEKVDILNNYGRGQILAVRDLLQSYGRNLELRTGYKYRTDTYYEDEDGEHWFYLDETDYDDSFEETKENVLNKLDEGGCVIFATSQQVHFVNGEYGYSIQGDGYHSVSILTVHPDNPDLVYVSDSLTGYDGWADINELIYVMNNGYALID